MATPLLPRFIAVDIGTAYSGFAHAIGAKSKPEQYVMQTVCGEQRKTQTVVLLNEDGSLHSFGKVAWDFYTLLDDDQAERYYLFDRFKMNLQRDKEVHGDIMIKARNAEKAFPVKLIFKRVLEFFYNEAKESICITSGIHKGTEWSEVEKDITWIITVPAIWGDRAKEFMKNAAIEAGMGNLVISLEPEGASLLCRDVMLEAARELTREKLLPLTLRYMVVDCGGGTVDITVHNLDRQSMEVEEVHRPTGGAWGGTYVDDEVKKLIRRAVGHRVAEQLTEENWLELTRINVETAKRSMAEGLPQVRIALPVAFLDAVSTAGGDLLQSCKAIEGVSFRKRIGTLVIDSAVMERCFKKSLDDIVGHIERLLRQCGTVESILVVGGYAESMLLIGRMRKEFESGTCRVIRPNNPSLAVLSGALMYGQNPGSIVKRISKYTYGLELTEHFDPDKHAGKERTTYDGIDYCCGVFDTIVEVDTPVKIGQVFKAIRIPVKSDQKFVPCRLYQSEDRNVKFTAGLEPPLATLEVELPNVTDARECEIEIRWDFSQTQIHVYAQEVTSEKVYKVVTTFHHQ